MNKIFRNLALLFFLFGHILFFDTVNAATLNCGLTNNCVIFVDSKRIVDGDGSIENPFKRVTDAIGFLKNHQDYNTINVAEGFYHDGEGNYFESMPWNFTAFGRTVILNGGFYDGFKARDSLRHQTVFDAAGGLNIFNFNSTSFKLDGVVLTGVNGNGASALQVHNNSDSNRYNVEIKNSFFQNNQAVSGVPDIDLQLNQRSNGIIENNTFVAARDSLGNAIQLVGQVVFRSNFIKATIVKKSFYCGNGVKAFNNVFTQNHAQIMINLGGGCLFDHNTIHDNHPVIGGGGIFSLSGGGNFVRNNLLAANYYAIGSLILKADKDNSFFDYNATALDDAVDLNNLMGSHNVICDPRFSNDSQGGVNNFRLGSGSTCFDTGLNLNYPSVDYYGNKRQIDGDFDGIIVSDPGAIEAFQDQKIAGLKELKLSVPGFNPLAKNNNKLNFSFKILREARVSVVVLDGSHNEIIRLMDNVNRVPGTVNLEWSGQNHSGVFQPKGDYLLMVTATVDDLVQNLSKSVFIDMVSSFDQCAGFVDVEKQNPACAAIQFVKNRGIFIGYADGTFRGDTVINRVETLKVILVAFGQKLVVADGSNYGFVDLDQQQWYMSFVPTAKYLGILNGYNDQTLRPFAQINRAELLKIFFIAAGRSMDDIDVLEPPFKDVTDLKIWYAKYVQFVKNHQLMDAVKGNFYPTMGMKRADVAELLFRYHNAGLGL